MLRLHENSLLVSCQNRTIKLTRKEFKILVELSAEIGCARSREELYANVWGDSVFVDERTIDRHIVRLRRKLKELGQEAPSIDTVWGIGYRLRH